MNKKQSFLNLLLAAVLAVSLVAPFSVQEAQAASWLSGWDKRIEITVDNTNIDSDLTHFPLPILVNDSAGQDDDDLTVIFDEVGDEDQKIAVTKADGTTQIYIEVENWDNTAEEALLWVSKSDLTLSSASTTTLYIYYDSEQSDNTTYVAGVGSRTEVWDSDYEGVWHMADDPSGGTLTDSTSNSKDGTFNGSMVAGDRVDGSMGGYAIDFDGSDDYVDLGSNDMATGSQNRTLEVLGHVDDSDSMYVFSLGNTETITDYRVWRVKSNEGSLRIEITAAGETSSFSFTSGTQTFFGGKLDGTKMEDHVAYFGSSKEVLNSGGSNTLDTYNDDAVIATKDDITEYWDGEIEEVRFSSVARSDAWMKTDYYAMTDDLLSYGAEETADTTDPTLSSTTPADDATDVTTTANLVLTFDEAVDVESGNIVIKETSDDSTFETIGVTSGNVTGTGTTTITVNPTGEFDNSTEYYVQVDATAFDDEAGNSYAGISDTTSWSFTTEGELAFDWGTPSVTVSDAVIQALDDALGVYRPDDEYEHQSNMWIVTGLSDTDHSDYQFASVIGIIAEDPEEVDSWTLETGVWMGLAIVEDEGGGSYSAAFEGSVGYNNRLDDADLSDPSYYAGGGSGSYNYIFPWITGTLARYGYKAVHYDVGPPGTGYGANGWAAVDFVGGTVGYPDNIFPNGAYVIEAGEVSYMCEDDVQTWVQIGNFLYGHLVYNSNLEVGSYHNQGDYLGALVTGSHSLSEPGVWCGHMDQQPTSYHLHLGFKPSGNYFQMEDWVLNLTTEKWVKGSDEVAPLEHLLAEWGQYGDVPPIPTPGGPTPTPGGPTPTPVAYVIEGGSAGGGASFWNGFVNMAESIVWNRMDDMEDHSHRDVSNLTVSGVRIAVSTVYVLLRSNLNLTITMIVFGALFILEPVRILRSIWMGIKEMIPFVG